MINYKEFEVIRTMLKSQNPLDDIAKYVYNNKPTIEVFHTIMQTMNEKAEKATGNKLNHIAWAA